MPEPPYGHQSSAIAAGRIVRLGVIGALVVASCIVLLKTGVDLWVTPQHARLIARAALIPPAPRLQPHPRADLKELRQEKDALLSNWAWSDGEHRFARVPIERAMAIYAAQKRVKQDRPSAPPGSKP